MATSWMIVERDGKRRVVDLKTFTKQGVRAAAARAVKSGNNVVAAYLGGPRPIALCQKVYL